MVNIKNLSKEERAKLLAELQNEESRVALNAVRPTKGYVLR